VFLPNAAQHNLHRLKLRPYHAYRFLMTFPAAPTMMSANIDLTPQMADAGTLWQRALTIRRSTLVDLDV
jgi:hypothetical protein